MPMCLFTSETLSVSSFCFELMAKCVLSDFLFMYYLSHLASGRYTSQ